MLKAALTSIVFPLYWSQNGSLINHLPVIKSSIRNVCFVQHFKGRKEVTETLRIECSQDI